MVLRLAGILLLLCGAGVVCPAADSPKELARKAREAEQKGDAARAYLLYAQAAAADPQEPSYWTRAQALRTRALRQSPSLPAVLESSLPAPPDAGEETLADTLITRDDLEEARFPLPPKELDAIPGTRNFQLNLDHKGLYTEVTKAFGIDLVFDSEFQAGTPMRFRLEDADLATALRALQAATSTFVVPLGPKLLMVYKDTQQKRAEGEPTVAVALSLPQPVQIQEAQEVARAVQQALEIQKFAIDGSRRLVLIRDRVSKVRAAQNLYEQLLTHRSQILFEVELIDMAENYELSYGFDLPTSTALSFLGRRNVTSAASRLGFRLIPDFMPGFTRYLMLGGGLSTVAVAIADAKAFANFTQSHSIALFRAQLRSVDSQAANLHIGDKYPIITQQFLGAPDSISPFAVPPTFNFEDLGLTLKITPRIHDADEVSLTIESEYKVLGNETFNGIPAIATRKFASTVRVRDGEWAVLLGMMSSSEARTISGIPGLANLPLLHHALARTTRSRQYGEALIVIKPRILDAATTENQTRSIYTGSESRWITLPGLGTRVAPATP